MIIGGYFFFYSWFLRAELGSVVGVRHDYSLQLTHDGFLYDSKQSDKVISNYISRYKLAHITDKAISNKSYDILITEEGYHNPPVYIIYDDMLDAYIFVNKKKAVTWYWVGGYYAVTEKDDLVQKRYKKLIEDGDWITLKPTGRWE